MDLIEKIKNMQIYLEHERQELQTIDEYESDKRLHTIHILDEILEDYENGVGNTSEREKANELLLLVSDTVCLLCGDTGKIKIKETGKEMPCSCNFHKQTGR